jgi:hypothetical protein
MSVLRADRDRWLFLTPEVEREGPALLERLAPAAGAATSAQDEADRIEALIRGGSDRDWFAYLRDCRSLLERALGRGGDAEAALRLACVLREQYLLAPSVRTLDAADSAELARLSALVHEEKRWTLL